MINTSKVSAEDGASDAEPAGSSRAPFEAKFDCAKFLLLGGAYTGVIVIAHWLAYLIRFEFHPAIEYQELFWRTLQWAVPVELGFLFVFGQFRSLLSYFSLPDANRIVLACAATTAIALGVWYATGGAHAPPRSIIILSFLLDTVGLVSVRVFFRRMREWQRTNGKNGDGAIPRRIAIIGAGDVGANLAKELIVRQDMGMSPVAFFDDDQAKWGKRLHGIPIEGPPEMIREKGRRVEEAIFAMPSASGRRVREVVQILNEAHIRFETVPSIEQLVSGAVKVSQIRPVELEDLLGREPVTLCPDRINDLIQGKVVMVTGAGGSIGGELCRQIAKYNPRRLLLLERCEVQMFQIEQELLGAGCGAQIVPLVADILDDERMRGVFERFRPRIIFHAAAHKHVPMMESQPYEAFRNNTIGTEYLAKLSAEFQAERFVLVSTDKAINPTNAMGATKRLAELYIQALQGQLNSQTQTDRPSRLWNSAAAFSESAATRGKQREDAMVQAPHVLLADTVPGAAPTKFMAVRFGNVLGSSGSVIPTFKKQIAAGGPVTVTHPEITRYFMTIPEAVGLVLQSATLGQGGEIFVLDMGKMVKIVDVARQLIELSGLKPDLDIEIKFTGLRPGEKLFEEINHDGENMVPTDHPKIMRFVGEPLPFETLREGLLGIREKAASLGANQVKLEIQKLVPEYKPYLE
jgi:FlaA1/EpsC-like NDP-sugar epimerase